MLGWDEPGCSGDSFYGSRGVTLTRTRTAGACITSCFGAPSDGGTTKPIDASSSPRSPRGTG